MSEDVYPKRVVCKNCFAAFAPEDLRRTAGNCPVCRMRVCPRCGCTDSRGCVAEAADGPYTCTWADNFGEVAGVRFTLKAYCTFCAFVIAEHEYSKAPGPEEVQALWQEIVEAVELELPDD